jgi:hypothetical protein
MTSIAIPISIRQVAVLAMSACLIPPARATAQLITFSNQDLLDYTPQNPFGRFPDDRPRVPDDLIERARGLSAEEIRTGLKGKFHNQYADGHERTP